MTAGVQIKDRGWNKLRDFFCGGLQGSYKKASVGIQGDLAELKNHDSELLTNAELGAIHEYGTQNGRIPSRSFLRSTIDDNQAVYQGKLAAIVKKALGASNPTQVVESGLFVLGEKAAGDIKRRFNTGPFVPLAPATRASRDAKRSRKAKKGQTYAPLIDTGQLRDSISSTLVDPKER